jgi:hypothetical protein
MKCEFCTRGCKTRLRGSNHSALGETAWRKFLMGKIGLREGGILWTSRHLQLDKILTLDICTVLE